MWIDRARGCPWLVLSLEVIMSRATITKPNCQGKCQMLSSYYATKCDIESSDWRRQIGQEKRCTRRERGDESSITMTTTASDKMSLESLLGSEHKKLMVLRNQQRPMRRYGESVSGLWHGDVALGRIEYGDKSEKRDDALAPSEVKSPTRWPQVDRPDAERTVQERVRKWSVYCGRGEEAGDWGRIGETSRARDSLLVVQRREVVRVLVIRKALPVARFFSCLPANDSSASYPLTELSNLVRPLAAHLADAARANRSCCLY
ncbi:uncharacterized protein BCR38DRAFT_516389 [Pseudomassariella vexata]|uniref:Uncharacterized protein n=1 Tax=Pseudomassariella vexata TaxID=1141098 RepID=A0A1Y2DVW3_9PEZI|nr:uncharacterized protein BCR38DRAFT_516389 [Pseudomassariella vexata]ORY63254.1 hypothetical protein BCR38DRAFT_516389 [Pseudomassariella vexata]